MPWKSKPANVLREDIYVQPKHSITNLYNGETIWRWSSKAANRLLLGGNGDLASRIIYGDDPVGFWSELHKVVPPELGTFDLSLDHLDL